MLSSIQGVDGPPPMPVSASNVRYSIELARPGVFWKRWCDRIKGIPAPKKEILKGIDFEATPGEIVALMGPSGSGKTTLLNAVSGRLPSEGLSGEIRFGGRSIDFIDRSRVAYVLQDDVCFGELTVRQTILFTALLRLPWSGADEEVKSGWIDDLIDRLGLQKCKNTVIGGPFVRGVSGGERKRTNIALEILSGPSVLLLDEPTSGLDAHLAKELMILLRELAKTGITVIVSIHQPASPIFQMFDRLLLLSKGQTAYFGPADGVLDRFAQLGFRCPEHYNPADFVIEILSQHPEKFDRSQDQPQELLSVSDGGADEEERISFEPTGSISSNTKRFDPTNVGSQKRDPSFTGNQAEQSRNKDDLVRRSSPPFWYQTWVLFRRSMTRQKDLLFDPALYFQIFFLAVVCGLIYLQLPEKTSHLSDRIGVILFFILQTAIYLPALKSVFSFPPERAVLRRELKTESYPLSAYFLSKNLSDMIFHASYSTIFVLIVYWMIGLNPDPGRFFVCLLLVLCANWASCGMGLVLSAAIQDVSFSAITATVVAQVWTLSCGFFIKIDHMTVFTRWLQWISLIHYTYQPILRNEFEGTEFKSNVSGNVSGEHILKELDIRSLDPLIYAPILVGFGMLFRVVSFLLLRRSLANK